MDDQNTSSPATGEKKSKANPRWVAKHAARIAAVQGAYQREQVPAPVEDVIDDFITHRLNGHPAAKKKMLVDRNHFKDLLRGHDQFSEQIDALVEAALGQKWTLAKIESVLRAILRMGVCEFLLDKGVSCSLIISEYVNVTKDFYGGKEPGFVNGVLDNVARALDLADVEKKRPKDPAPVDNYLKPRNTSGVKNWENEGGHS